MRPPPQTCGNNTNIWQQYISTLSQKKIPTSLSLSPSLSLSLFLFLSLGIIPLASYGTHPASMDKTHFLVATPGRFSIRNQSPQSSHCFTGFEVFNLFSNQGPFSLDMMLIHQRSRLIPLLCFPRFSYFEEVEETQDFSRYKISCLSLIYPKGLRVPSTVSRSLALSKANAFAEYEHPRANYV